MGWMTSKLFQFWQEDVQKGVDMAKGYPNRNADRFISKRIIHWEETFLYLCQLISNFNRCFRLVLLLMIIRIFIVITMLPFLALSFSSMGIPADAFYLESSIHFVVLLVILYIPWKIKKEARTTISFTIKALFLNALILVFLIDC